MLRRILALLAVAAVSVPLGARAQDREWEEDYTDQYRNDAPPPEGDYQTSVDVDQGGAVNFDTFQGSLAPYGDWVVVGGYGRCWRPRVAAGWRPYYYGRWEWTNEGWLWVSDEPWGWASYHYGRWTFDPSYGWVWVPGYQWAPAWVAWRYSGDVVGWAPLGPGVSVYVSTYPFVDYWWTFVPTGRFVGAPVYQVAYAPSYTRQYFYGTAPAPPRPVPSRPMPGGRAVPSPAWGGPAPRAIEQRIGRPLTPVRVVPAPSPGPGRRVGPGEVEIYRPGRAAPGRAGVRGAPAPAPGRAGGAAEAPGRGGGFGPPARGGAAPAPGREAPGRGEGRPAPAPGRGGERERGDGRGAPTPPGSRGDAGFGPRGGGYAAPSPRYDAPQRYERAPSRYEGAPRGGYAPPAPPSRGGSAAPAPVRGGGYAPPAPSHGGGYAPPAPSSHGGGYSAPAPAHGGGAPAPRAEGGRAEGRPAPGREHR